MKKKSVSAIAASVLAASGLPPQSAPSAHRCLALARKIASRAKCHISTAKRHLARAMALAANPGYIPPKHGGKRAGAGRHPNDCQCEACKADT